jgi:hypothetical protein
MYREHWNLLEREEEMALLVQRVSGEDFGTYYYPHVAGAGFSFNPFVWNPDIDPKSGFLRLVFGLGTRAVDRADDDYTRLVALNAPSRRPESNFDEVCEYSQHRVDYLDLAENRVTSGYFLDLAKEERGIPLETVASRDESALATHGVSNYVLTFDKLLSNTPFVQDMRDMLATIEDAYQNPVDIEFTATFLDDDRYKINLLQCRPLQVQGVAGISLPKVEATDTDRIVEAHGAIIGPSRIVRLDRFIYVVPKLYGQLPLTQRYEVARLLGRINQAGARDPGTVMLLGPGRWGTSSPELGIPVHFGEISRVAVLCEIVTMRENLIPDVSLGTHFLNELVEMNILYMALFPQQQRNYLDEGFFLDAPNRLLDLVPGASQWQDMVRVVETKEVLARDRAALLLADAEEQQARIFVGSAAMAPQKTPSAPRR